MSRLDSPCQSFVGWCPRSILEIKVKNPKAPEATRAQDGTFRAKTEFIGNNHNNLASIHKRNLPSCIT